MLSEPDRTRGLVVEVLRGALARRGLEAVRLVSPPSPEARILTGWLEEAGIPLVGRTAGTGDAGDAGDAGNGDPARDEDPVPADGHGGDTLDVHAANKLQLLLEAPLAPCLPLGDVWWSQLMEWGGAATLPAALAHLSEGDARKVEAALRGCVEGGRGLLTSLEGLAPELRAPVERAFRRSGGWGHPVLIPKLTEWTWGLDPHY